MIGVPSSAKIWSPASVTIPTVTEAELELDCPEAELELLSLPEELESDDWLL